ncbi:transposase [Thiolapillus sp.]|uniref:transposase n=1 Tax=Thiolapillus sp. TaxID=2017437 RepID=UPI003AF4B6A5
MGEDRKKATLKAWYESLTEAQREAIESISMDMWPAFINRCQPWRAKRRLVVPSSREAALFSRRALRQRENKVGLRTRRPVIGSQVRSSNELAKLLRSAW